MQETSQKVSQLKKLIAHWIGGTLGPVVANASMDILYPMQDDKGETPKPKDIIERLTDDIGRLSFEQTLKEGGLDKRIQAGTVEIVTDPTKTEGTKLATEERQSGFENVQDLIHPDETTEEGKELRRLLEWAEAFHASFLNSLRREAEKEDQDDIGREGTRKQFFSEIQRFMNIRSRQVGDATPSYEGWKEELKKEEERLAEIEAQRQREREGGMKPNG